jgi:hypothetical protein
MFLNDLTSCFRNIARNYYTKLRMQNALKNYINVM